MWPTHVLHTVPGLSVFWLWYSVCRVLAWSASKGPSHWTTYQWLWAAEAKHNLPQQHTDKSYTKTGPCIYFPIPCKPRGAIRNSYEHIIIITTNACSVGTPDVTLNLSLNQRPCKKGSFRAHTLNVTLNMILNFDQTYRVYLLFEGVILNFD